MQISVSSFFSAPFQRAGEVVAPAGPNSELVPENKAKQSVKPVEPPTSVRTPEQIAEDRRARPREDPPAGVEIETPGGKKAPEPTPKPREAPEEEAKRLVQIQAQVEERQTRVETESAEEVQDAPVERERNEPPPRDVVGEALLERAQVEEQLLQEAYEKQIEFEEFTASEDASIREDLEVSKQQEEIEINSDIVRDQEAERLELLNSLLEESNDYSSPYDTVLDLLRSKGEKFAE